MFLRLVGASKHYWLLASIFILSLNLSACVAVSRILSSNEMTVIETETVMPQTSSNELTEASDYCMSDFEPIPLPRLIAISKLVVVGEVTQIQDKTFTFRIQDSLIGEVSNELIEVKQYIPRRFECPREAAYATGQHFMLFLVPNDDENTRQVWLILGINGEGEMPIEDGFVYFHGRFVEGLERHEYLVHGSQRLIQRFSVELFKAAVHDYPLCFQWQTNSEDNRLEPRLVCNEQDLEHYRTQSVIHEYLAVQTLQRLSNNS